MKLWGTKYEYCWTVTRKSLVSLGADLEPMRNPDLHVSTRFIERKFLHIFSVLSTKQIQIFFFHLDNVIFAAHTFLYPASKGFICIAYVI
jgi:hypothetical protein